MAENTTFDSQNWKIGTASHSFEKWFKNHSSHVKHIEEFEADVKKNPYRHSTKRKISPVQSAETYPPGCYRWRKSDLRIVYLPKKSDHTVYPLDANSAGGIGYK